MQELPTSAEILRKIPALKNSDTTQTDEIRKWTFEKTQIIQDTVSLFIEKENLKEDPDIYQERLYRYHLLCGGMSGLAEALYERTRYLIFKDLTENSRTATTDNKAKLTAGDRELYAKGQVSDLKGLVTSLNNMASNLESRLYGCRASSRKW